MSSLFIDPICTRTSRKGIQNFTVLSMAHWFTVYIGMPFHFKSTYRYPLTKTMGLGTFMYCVVLWLILYLLIWSNHLLVCIRFRSSRQHKGSYHVILFINLIHCRSITAVVDLIIVYRSFVFLVDYPNASHI
jgi:hypothetical protein